MIEAVRRYLALLKSPPESQDDRIQALAEALDRLAFAYHSTPGVLVADTPDPAIPASYQQVRDEAVRAFPDFGFYAVVRPDANEEREMEMGDAIDDLADIALDMKRIEWRWDYNGPQDAAWHFRFGYRTHWGRHLHDLRSYVHDKQFGS
jgi:uncharacterized protein DUF5063